MRQNAEILGSYFADYRVILYENNSTDGTKELLEEWQKQNWRVVALSEDLSLAELKDDSLALERNGTPFRTELIAKARNKLLDLIRSDSFDSFPYVVMVDWDFRTAWPFQEIRKTIETRGDWDCVAANGVIKNHEYYDLYALRSSIMPLGPELLGDGWWDELQHFLLSGKEWIPVYSAFGGLAIYKKDKLLLGSYSGHFTEELIPFYREIMSSLPPSNFYFRWYRGSYGLSESDVDKIPVICFEKNGYYNYGTYQAGAVCEHVVMHAKMRIKGASKIYINPQLRMYYKL